MGAPSAPQTEYKRPRRRRNGLVAAACFCAVIGMTAMAYAAVPLYQLFCQVTGYGGTAQRVEVVADRVLERTIVVRFDANVAAGLRWKFKPVQRQITVRLGETANISYLARNTSARAGAASATFNVTPDIAGVYFNKLECFCFTEQKLAGGAEILMPVVFYVDPDLADDPDLAHVRTITLSYTFFASGPTPKDGNL
jgi:cytochrome c oxidase assembly protein subunit 11